MKITIIAGARPNFMKIAPIIRQIKKAQKDGVDLKFRLVHTGQHYDHKMSDTFFRELDIPLPDINLGCGGGSQSQQTASILIGFEKELQENPCDLVLVVGDVTSTMACSIVAKKMGTKVAHVEGGIRSFDLSMPEEINRMVTDAITDYFFTTSSFANTNLKKSGIDERNIFFVGNVMIDTLLYNLDKFKKPDLFDEFKLQAGNFLVLTLHRPSNVDDHRKVVSIINSILASCNNFPVIFPIHPRTKKVFQELNIEFPNLFLIDPLGYLEFNYLVKHSKAVITDSGGITEETTVFGVPCLTLRENTERPETIDIGTNVLVGTNPNNIKKYLDLLFEDNWKTGGIPYMWDGKASERIINHLIELM